MKRKTVVIFGVSSFVGSNLAYFLKDHFRVIGTYNLNKVEIPDETALLPICVLRAETNLTVHRPLAIVLAPFRSDGKIP